MEYHIEVSWVTKILTRKENIIANGCENREQRRRQRGKSNT
jgi:hypothetical protein